jgi:hypothetical protein
MAVPPARRSSSGVPEWSDAEIDAVLDLWLRHGQQPHWKPISIELAFLNAGGELNRELVEKGMQRTNNAVMNKVKELLGASRTRRAKPRTATSAAVLAAATGNFLDMHAPLLRQHDWHSGANAAAPESSHPASRPLPSIPACQDGTFPGLSMPCQPHFCTASSNGSAQAASSMMAMAGPTQWRQSSSSSSCGSGATHGSSIAPPYRIVPPEEWPREVPVLEQRDALALCPHAHLPAHAVSPALSPHTVPSAQRCTSR